MPCFNLTDKSNISNSTLESQTELISTRSELAFTIWIQNLEWLNFKKLGPTLITKTSGLRNRL